jgi:LysM repeat protein
MSGRSWVVGVLAAGCGGGVPETPAVVVTEPVESFVPLVRETENLPLEDVVLASVAVTEPGPDPAIATEPVAVYRLRRGETLAHYARWSGLPVEEIAERSGLDLDAVLDVGTPIVIPVGAELRATIDASRDAHHTRRAEGYLASRGGATGTEYYRVRTGDSAWSIAHAHGPIPVWLVETYNPSVDLDALRPGMELLLPVLGDTVANGEPSPTF